MPKAYLKTEVKIKTPTLVPVAQSLVIGDVGSGKTAVAFMVGLNYLLGIQTGQVALLAPTEVLAFQHYQNLQNWVDNINLKYQTESGNKFNLPLNKLAKKSVNLDNQPQLFLGEISTIFVTSKNIQINGKQVTKKTLKDSLSTFSKIFFSCSGWVSRWSSLITSTAISSIFLPLSAINPNPIILVPGSMPNMIRSLSKGL